ncbi:hypothetical protein DBR06_SOUSAS2510050, partial [Sousa chinensis]
SVSQTFRETIYLSTPSRSEGRRTSAPGGRPRSGEGRELLPPFLPTPPPAAPASPAPPRMDGGSPTPAGGRTGMEGAAAAAQQGELSNLHLDPLTSRTVSTPVTVKVPVLAFSLPHPPDCLPSADPLPRGVPALSGYELFYGGTLNTESYKK